MYRSALQEFVGEGLTDVLPAVCFFFQKSPSHLDLSKRLLRRFLWSAPHILSHQCSAILISLFPLFDFRYISYSIFVNIIVSLYDYTVIIHVVY
jgi:hypothetical protein